jgi:hypothetical protein
MEQLVDCEPRTAKQFGGFAYSDNSVELNSLGLKHTSPFWPDLVRRNLA